MIVLRKRRSNEQGNRIIGIIFLFLLVGVGALAIWFMATQGEVNSSEVELPAYAYRTTAVTQAYVASLEQPSLFEFIPCYCGCGMSVGHDHLRDCFYNDYGEFSQHAAGCNICVDEAITIWRMYRQGSSLLEIRNTIDDQYSGGDYPEPTITPIPPN